MKYIDGLSKLDQEYFKILCPNLPLWLDDYIMTPVMQRLKNVSNACGTDYLKLYKDHDFYDVLSHSVGCALIVWNFTKDKKMTLASLFHDISTPTFKHCIDFLNGDYLLQESTEDLTTEMIKNSKEIMDLLNKDGIKLEEVNDYHLYPICDNSSPRLSSDRLEYTLKNGLLMHYDLEFTLEDIKYFYNDIVVLKNEDGLEELGFKHQNICEEFIVKVSNMWPHWCDNRNNLCFEFYADIIKKLLENKEITKKELYEITEEEIITRIKNSHAKNLGEAFQKFLETDKYYESDEEVLNKNYYVINISSKKRYLNPLVKVEGTAKRIDKLSKEASAKIKNFQNLKFKKYAYFTFNI